MSMSNPANLPPSSGAQPTPLDLPASPRPQSKQLLEQVLKETVSAWGDLPPGTAILEALKVVAARHGNQPVTTPEVATDFIEAALNVGWPGWGNQFSDPRAVASEISAALIDDPLGRARLESLWSRLAEGPK
jgi:hypothetical protein